MNDKRRILTVTLSVLLFTIYYRCEQELQCKSWRHLLLPRCCDCFVFSVITFSSHAWLHECAFHRNEKDPDNWLYILCHTIERAEVLDRLRRRVWASTSHGCVVLSVLRLGTRHAIFSVNSCAAPSSDRIVPDSVAMSICSPIPMLVALHASVFALVGKHEVY